MTLWYFVLFLILLLVNGKSLKKCFFIMLGMIYYFFKNSSLLQYFEQDFLSAYFRLHFLSDYFLIHFLSAYFRLHFPSDYFLLHILSAYFRLHFLSDYFFITLSRCLFSITLSKSLFRETLKSVLHQSFSVNMHVVNIQVAICSMPCQCADIFAYVCCTVDPCQIIFIMFLRRRSSIQFENGHAVSSS